MKYQSWKTQLFPKTFSLHKKWRSVSGAPYVINECFLQTKWGRAKGKYATIGVRSFLEELFPIGQDPTKRACMNKRKDKGTYKQLINICNYLNPLTPFLIPSTE